MPPLVLQSKLRHSQDRARIEAAGTPPHSVPSPVSDDAHTVAERLEELRTAIRSIERKPTAAVPPETALPEARSSPPAGSPSAIWTLGDPVLDALVGGALETAAVHEIKPERGGAWTTGIAAARRFALGLALRRLAACPADRVQAPVLWCASQHHASQAGRPYGPGLAALRLDPTRLILVEPAREVDVLWTIEEGLKSHALALVVGELTDVDLTPARRLALAAAASLTPTLLLTSARSASLAATATRWRIAPAPSAPHPFDPGAPGTSRCNALLERCRSNPTARSVELMLEWSDVTRSFRMASGMADRQAPTCVVQSSPAPAMARL